jgi:hypothetical protein
MPLLFILVVSNIYASLRDLKPYKMQLWVDLHLNFMSETECRMLVSRLWKETGERTMWIKVYKVPVRRRTTFCGSSPFMVTLVNSNVF